MVEVKSYVLPSTALIPNSPQPLLHYPGYFEECDRAQIHDLFHSNGWQTQWIFRYGPTQSSHYHSAAHECMVVLTGSATIRFGVADTVDDLEESTHGTGKESGGVELHANPGDVFIIPAGVAHKTFDTGESTFKLLTPGNGHGIDGDIREKLSEIELSGFTMMGAYPTSSSWNFAVGGEDKGNYSRVWAVAKPEKDPILGTASEGIRGLWNDVVTS